MYQEVRISINSGAVVLYISSRFPYDLERTTVEFNAVGVMLFTSLTSSL